jgi:ubiquinone/menaquinone biosynthesis C-methylase UbiE
MTSQQNSQRKLFEEFLASPGDLAKIDIIKELLSKKTMIIDLPCGTGKLTSALGLFGTVIGVDLSKGRIYHAKKSNHFIDFVIADAHHLPFKEAQFDLIVVKDGFEHFQDDNSVMAELSLISRSLCQLLLYVPVSYKEAKFSLESLVFKLTKYSIDDKVGHVRRYSSNQLSKLLYNKGFKVQTKRYYAHLFVGLISLFSVSMREFMNKKGSTVRESGLTRMFGYLDRICFLEYKLFRSLPGAGVFVSANKVIGAK